MTPAVVSRILCCLPRGDGATRALISGALVAYGFGEGKSWAKWMGIAGLALTGLEIARCYVRVAALDDADRSATARPAPRQLAPSPPPAGDASQGSPDLRLVPADMEPA